MFYVPICSFLLAVLLTLSQSQRLTTTTDAPWIWGDDRNPSTRTTSTEVTNTVSTTSSSNATPTNPPSPRICPGCPRTPEFNPVCGSDNATYNNPSAVKCANTCGPEIRILFYAACQPTAR